MAVESRFVVIRQGVEMQTFMDKKAADEYDKMLDVADNLSGMFEQSSLSLDEQLIEDLSIYLAQHKDDLLVALQVKKAKPAARGKKPATPTVVIKESKIEAAVIETPIAEDANTEEPVKPRTRKKVVKA